MRYIISATAAPPLRDAATVEILNRIEKEALEAQKPSNRFNLTAGITNIAELEETRRREQDPAEVNK